MTTNPAIQFETASKIEHVGGLCASLREFLNDYGIQKPSDTEIVFRELITNAIVHGNGMDSNKLVQIRVEVARDLVFISVQDQGRGFDYQTLSNMFSGSTRKRGFALIKMLTTRVEFNDTGSQVTVWIPRGRREI